MKNTMRLVGIIALVAVIGFSFAACNNGSTDSGGSKFEGRWLNEYALTQGFTDFSYTFSGTNFTHTSVGRDNYTLSGTFTFTDTTITFTVTEGGSGTGTMNYTLSGTTLSLQGDIGIGVGEFTKQ